MEKGGGGGNKGRREKEEDGDRENGGQRMKGLRREREWGGGAHARVSVCMQVSEKEIYCAG